MTITLYLFYNYTYITSMIDIIIQIKRKNDFEQNTNINAIIMINAIKVYFEKKFNHPSKSQVITDN